MEPKDLLKPCFETSVTFEPFGIFDAVFTVVLRRMSSVILYMCVYLLWGLFNNYKLQLSTSKSVTLNFRPWLGVRMVLRKSVDRPIPIYQTVYEFDLSKGLEIMRCSYKVPKSVTHDVTFGGTNSSYPSM